MVDRFTVGVTTSGHLKREVSVNGEYVLYREYVKLIENMVPISEDRTSVFIDGFGLLPIDFSDGANKKVEKEQPSKGDDGEDTVVVSARALKEVLQALIGPPHHIRELQAIRSLGNSPIDTLVNQFNGQMEERAKNK